MREPYRRFVGFSTLELVVGVSVLAIVAGMALVSMAGALPGLRANAGLEQLAEQVRTARESAMAEHRSYHVRLIAPDKIQLRRLESPSGSKDFPAVSLGNTVQFTLFPGLPDTPDRFGNAAAIALGGTTLTVLSNGKAIDSTGAPVKGSIFIGVPDHPATARAVTIEGATGRVTAYHWTGSAWEE